MSHNALSTFNGCYIPCCLNILGIILFQRLSWAVGQAGVMGTVAIFALAESMAILTVFSFSAIVTNGSMKGGGSYFMISRSLGPEFGGAIGSLFYLAYAVGVAFYISGFAQAVVDTFGSELFGEASVHGAAQGLNVPQIVVGSFGLLLVLTISYIGAGVFARFNVVFFVVQMSAIAYGAWCVAFSPTRSLHEDLPLPNCVNASLAQQGAEWWHAHSDCVGYEKMGFRFNSTIQGFSIEQLRKNLWPNYDYVYDESACQGQLCSFHNVFAIVFPAATGIMEGANLSGDLADPARSIPRGTIFAVLTALVCYAVLIVVFAGSFNRSSLMFDDNVFQEATRPSGVLLTGILVSSLSSALGSLFGGARVLQALARDDLFPWPLSGVRHFAKGSEKGDEPRRAVVLTWAIAQSALFLGDLNAIAPVITSCFCLSYALCNLTCFLLLMTGAPNFRPVFRTMVSWQTSALGFALNIGVMIWLSPLAAFCGLAALCTIFTIVWVKGPEKDWGDISQALLFHQLRKYLLKLNAGEKNAKFWRPNYLLLADNLAAHDLVAFCEHSKKGGLFVAGTVCVGAEEEVRALADAVREKRNTWMELIRSEGLKAFPQVAMAGTKRQGCRFLMTCSGLGAMDINTVVVPIPARAREQGGAPGWPATPGGGRGAGGASGPPAAAATLADATLADAPGGAEGADRCRLHRLRSNVDMRLTLGPAEGSSEPARGPGPQSSAFVDLVGDALSLRRNVVVAAGFRPGGLWCSGRDTRRRDARRPPGSFIDVWIGADDLVAGHAFDPLEPFNFSDTTSLMLYMAHILSLNQHFCKHARLRVFKLVPLRLASAGVQAAALDGGAGTAAAGTAAARADPEDPEVGGPRDGPRDDGRSTVSDQACAFRRGVRHALMQRLQEARIFPDPEDVHCIIVDDGADWTGFDATLSAALRTASSDGGQRAGAATTERRRGAAGPRLRQPERGIRTAGGRSVRKGSLAPPHAPPPLDADDRRPWLFWRVASSSDAPTRRRAALAELMASHERGHAGTCMTFVGLPDLPAKDSGDPAQSAAVSAEWVDLIRSIADRGRDPGALRSKPPPTAFVKLGQTGSVITSTI